MSTKNLCVLIHIWSKGEIGTPWKRFKPSSKIFYWPLLTVPRRCFFCGSFVWFMSCVCHAFAFVHCCLVVTWRERADLLALVCDVYCDSVTFPFGILGQVWFWSYRFFIFAVFLTLLLNNRWLLIHPFLRIIQFHFWVEIPRMIQYWLQHNKQLAIQCEKLNVYSILNHYYKSHLRAAIFWKGKTLQIQ